MDVYTLNANEGPKYFKGNLILDSGIMGPCITTFGIKDNQITAKHFLMTAIENDFEQFINATIKKLGQNIKFYTSGGGLISRDDYINVIKNNQIINYHGFIKKQEKSKELVEGILEKYNLDNITRWSPSGIGSRMIANNGLVNLLWFKNKNIFYNGLIEDAPTQNEFYKVLN